MLEDDNSVLNLAKDHIKPKSQQTLEDRWYLCKYLTWEQNESGKGITDVELIEMLQRIVEEGWSKKQVVEYYEEEIHGGRDLVLNYWSEKLKEKLKK